MKILDDNFMVCSDCLFAIANDDYTGLDYHYTAEEAEERMKDIQEGIQEAGGYEGGYIVCGDSEKDHDFSWSSCDCCGSDLAGSRHHCVILGAD